MDIEKFKNDIQGANIKEAKQIGNLVSQRLDQWIIILHNALPNNLQNTFGRQGCLSNIINNEGHSFWIFMGVNEVDVKQKIKEAKTIIQPVVKAWGEYGIKLNEIRPLPIGGKYIIEAHFTIS